MFKETGKISEVRKNNFYIIQIFPNNQNCSSCNYKEKCKSNNKQFLELKGQEGLSKGDIVDIYFPQNSKSFFLYYICKSNNCFICFNNSIENFYKFR